MKKFSICFHSTVLTACAALSLTSRVAAQATHTFLMDRHMSVVAGVSTVQTARYLLGNLQDLIIPSRLGREDTFGSKLGGIVFRTLKIGWLETPQNVLETTVVHEVFGHGARAREFGFPVSYRIDFPPPFGNGSGSTIFDRPLEIGVNVSRYEDLAITIAGIETSNMSWSRLADQWIERGAFDYRDASRFTTAQLTSFTNTLVTSGSDGSRYIAILNGMRQDDGKEFIDVDDFEVRSLVNLLNPLFVVALYRSAITYLFTGREVYSVPMISLGGGVRYVGWPRYILTPFGPEWGMENLFSRNGQQLRLRFRISDGIGASTVGGGVRVKKLFRSDRYSVDGRIEVWDQPGFNLLGRGLKTRSGGFGGALVSTVRFTPDLLTRGSLIWSIVGDLGYKTAGYLEGEALDRGLVLRVGGSFRSP